MLDLALEYHLGPVNFPAEPFRGAYKKEAEVLG